MPHVRYANGFAAYHNSQRSESDQFAKQAFRTSATRGLAHLSPFSQRV